MLYKVTDRMSANCNKVPVLIGSAHFHSNPYKMLNPLHCFCAGFPHLCMYSLPSAFSCSLRCTYKLPWFH